MKFIKDNIVVISSSLALFFVIILLLIVPDNNQKYDLFVEDVIPSYINVVYTNAGFASKNLIIRTNEIVFRNHSEYPIILKSDLDDFRNGLRLEVNGDYYYEFEEIGEYRFQEQKTGVDLKILVKNINNE